MAQITISDQYNTVYEILDTDKWDLNKPIARADFEDELYHCISVADRGGKEETARREKGWEEAGYSFKKT